MIKFILNKHKLNIYNNSLIIKSKHNLKNSSFVSKTFLKKLLENSNQQNLLPLLSGGVKIIYWNFHFEKNFKEEMILGSLVSNKVYPVDFTRQLYKIGKSQIKVIHWLLYNNNVEKI